jgi:hypothetical protein
METVAEAFCVNIQFKSVITFPQEHHVSYVPVFPPEKWPPRHDLSFFSFHLSRKIVIKTIDAQPIFSLFQFLKKKFGFLDYHGLCVRVHACFTPFQLLNQFMKLGVGIIPSNAIPVSFQFPAIINLNMADTRLVGITVTPYIELY